MKKESDYQSILLNEIPLIDVRAPIEFVEGALPCSVNLPLMNDLERHEVGLMYKAHGQAAAIELGHRLVNGDIKASRIQAWLEFTQLHPNAVLYCFRGGLRSKISQQWIKEAGVDIPVIEGGYKGVRKYFIEEMKSVLPQMNFQIVGGPTGSGKTQFVTKQSQFIDLENLACHRGSAFGGFSEIPQPTQINFENNLILELLKTKDFHQPIYIESESRMIGRCAIPLEFYDKMRASPRQEIELPLLSRVENIYREYIVESSLGRQQDANHFLHLQNSLNSIERKLGGLRYKELSEDLKKSQLEFLENGLLESNKIWIEKLLVWYYDPLYLHARGKYNSRLT